MNLVLNAQQHADLAFNAYGHRLDLRDLARSGEAVSVGGHDYEVRAFVDNPRTGYQGAIFQHVESGALVVAEAARAHGGPGMGEMVQPAWSMQVAQHGQGLWL